MRTPFGSRFQLLLRQYGAFQLGALLGLACRTLVIRVFGRRETRELRLARALGRTFGRLRGPFAKLGQFAALRVDGVAPELRAAFVELRDHVPPIPFDWVRAQIEAELQAPLSILFREIDSTPLGAASIAQVHAALLPDGRPVAVKVQYPWLARSLPTELWLVRLGCAPRRGT